MENERLWVTTIDNPFDPFKEFDEWKRFDEDHGYYTCEYIARIANTSTDLTESENDDAINDAVKEICRLNILGIYKKIRETEG